MKTVVDASVLLDLLSPDAMVAERSEKQLSQRRAALVAELRGFVVERAAFWAAHFDLRGRGGSGARLRQFDFGNGIANHAAGHAAPWLDVFARFLRVEHDAG